MDIFSHLLVVKIEMFVLNVENKWKRGRDVEFSKLLMPQTLCSCAILMGLPRLPTIFKLFNLSLFTFYISFDELEQNISQQKIFLFTLPLLTWKAVFPLSYFVLFHSSSSNHKSTYPSLDLFSCKLRMPGNIFQMVTSSSPMARVENLDKCKQEEEEGVFAAKVTDF